jgi:hypothetical protein
MNPACVMRPHAGEADAAGEMRSRRSIRITVRGRLSERLATAFEGMTLVRCSGATELVGEIVDQAQLYGLLTRIRDLGLELESVKVVDADPGEPARSGRDVGPRPRIDGRKEGGAR